MEKSQSDLVYEVLHRLDKAGLLKDMVLVGSWCILFYQEYFGSQTSLTVVRTRDMDLLIPQPRTIRTKTDVAQLLKDLGFVVGFTGDQGYIRLEHPQLFVEFLVPEKGRPTDKPYDLPQLGLNAQSLRFLDYLSQDTIVAKLRGIAITLPHPANFALHKLLIMSRRPKAEKRAKDKDAALRILEALVSIKQSAAIIQAFQAMPRRWQSQVKKQLDSPAEADLLRLLETRL